MYLFLAALSAVLVLWMIRIGRLDVPGARSSHAVPTPKGGGVGIVAACLCGFLWFGIPGARELACGVLLLALVSLADDWWDWPFAAKLAAQLAAAIALCVSGLVPDRLALPWGTLHLGAAAYPLAAAAILFVTNAVNFIDGLNGLASGCVGIAALSLAAAAPPGLAQEARILAAGIAGFLPFNYPRARIFMGDVGSQVCGFVAGCCLVQAWGDAHMLWIVPLALFPILSDVAFTLARRARAGARLTEAHRGHLYQVANRAGAPAAIVTLAYWAMSAYGGILGVSAGTKRLNPIAAIVLTAAIFLFWSVTTARKAQRAGLTRW